MKYTSNAIDDRINWLNSKLPDNMKLSWRTCNGQVYITRKETGMEVGQVDGFSSKKEACLALEFAYGVLNLIQ